MEHDSMLNVDICSLIIVLSLKIVEIGIQKQRINMMFKMEPFNTAYSNK